MHLVSVSRSVADTHIYSHDNQKLTLEDGYTLNTGFRGKLWDHNSFNPVDTGLKRSKQHFNENQTNIHHRQTWEVDSKIQTSSLL